MKKMILAAALCMTSSAFAYMCEVDMVDMRTNRLITTIRANDYGDDCKEGMKACRLEIRQRNLLNRADCVRRNDIPDTRPNPRPNPRPYPDTNPYPNPYPQSSDARRMIQGGDMAIMNNQYVSVIGVSYNGLYAVRSNDVWNTVTNNVRRENLSVTNGCNLGLCTSETVINTITRSYVKVIGLSYDDQFVTQTNDVWNTITSNNDRRNLAATKGCIENRYTRICVGNTVIDTFNRYSTIVGIQLDGRVVLKSSDVWNTITTNVDPMNLIVTR